LTRAAQKQTGPGPATRSGHRAPSPQLPQLPKTNRRKPASKPSSKPSIPREPPPPKPKPASKRAKRTVEPSDELVEESQEGGDLEEEDADLVAAQALLEAKDYFKKQRLRTYLQEKAVGVRAEVSKDLTTSDIQQELEDIVSDTQALADFPIEINLRIYINKGIAKRKNLPNSSRDTFDLSTIEEALLKELDSLVQGEVTNFSRISIVRANTSQGSNKIHDLDNFSFRETGRILGMVNTAREQHPRSNIILTIEVKVSVGNTGSRVLLLE
jgi:hypothetical protein